MNKSDKSDKPAKPAVVPKTFHDLEAFKPEESSVFNPWELMIQLNKGKKIDVTYVTAERLIAYFKVHGLGYDAAQVHYYEVDNCYLWLRSSLIA